MKIIDHQDGDISLRLSTKEAQELFHLVQARPGNLIGFAEDLQYEICEELPSRVYQDADANRAPR